MGDKESSTPQNHALAKQYVFEKYIVHMGIGLTKVLVVNH